MTGRVSRAGARSPNTTRPLRQQAAGGGGGGATPTLPENEIVGAPAYKQLWWGGYAPINNNTTGFNDWKNNAGFIGVTANPSAPTYSYADVIFGAGQQLEDFSVIPEGDTGGNHSWQRGWEGAASSGVTGAECGHFWYKHNVDTDYEAYLGGYVARANATSNNFWPPMGALALTGGNPTITDPDAREGSWWNDTYWTTAAAWFGKAGRAIKNVYFGSGLSFDAEPGNWFPASPTHTDAQDYQKCFDRAYQCGTAFFQNFPAGRIFLYLWSPTGSWGQWLRGAYNTGDTHSPVTVRHNNWALGWVKAMCDFGNASSRFILMDRDFYEWGEGGFTQGADPRGAKHKLNNEGSFAGLSQDYPYGVGQASWNLGHDRIFLAPTSWASTGSSSEKPAATPPITWAQQLAVDREWAMAPYRASYAGPSSGSAGGSPGTPYGLFYAQHGNTGSAVYGHMTTHLSGHQAAMSQTPIATSLPTCTSLTWSGSTLACRAAHYYGVKYVRVYNGAGFDPANPEPSFIGAMRMTWEHPSLPHYVGTPGNSGGNVSGSAPTLARVADSYQDCTFTTAGASGDWRVLKVMSTKDDAAWFRVQRA